MKFETLYDKALSFKPLSVEEGLFLYKYSPASELNFIANELRKKKNPGNTVTWIIDRNINITNVCIAGCKFCNFHRNPGSNDAFTTDIKSYVSKIEEMQKLGGRQILLQGGLHPEYNLSFYCDLFSKLKGHFPDIALHALSPPEIVHIAKKEHKNYKEVLELLIESGLDSLPGAGAEILCDRVRRRISPGKATVDEWLGVMKEAHRLNMITSATMMFGHIESHRERLEHLALIRGLQDERPPGSTGFTAFIPWPVILSGTKLGKEREIRPVLPAEYIRAIAISRIMLNNINNIQASWLTMGKEVAQLSLYAGANDMGSVMIEENVVASAGASHKMGVAEIQKAIVDAGFSPQLRNQAYESVVG